MAVERFKHDGKWKIIGSSSGKVQIADDKLDSESINSVQNKVITKALENKADIVDKLVNAYGIRSVSNTEYYMPDIGGVNPAHTLATKADIISNEALESKATMYNLYAMDDLTAEQLAANEAAFEAVQNGEVAIYRVYTNDTSYALADVKIVDGPYLEAYVYVNNPDTTSKQATVTKYTYTFNQAGEYTTSDKEEVVLPSLSKVEEMLEELPSGGGGEGAKIYEVYASPQNDDELAANIKVYNAVKNGENAIYRAYLGGMAWLTATLATHVSSLVNLTFEFSQNASDGSGLTATQFYIGLNSSGSPSYSSDSSLSIPSTSEVEEMIANVGGGAKIYQLPSGLFDSSQDNMYYFTAEEQQSFENAVMSADTMFFIAITDLEVGKVINIPLTLEFGLFFSLSGNKVLVSTLSSGEVELSMKIWEFHIIDGVRGWMVETEKVIWKG